MTSHVFAELVTPRVVCTGVTASWCPIHGDCTCPRHPLHGYTVDSHDSLEPGMNDPACPLHAPDSEHGEWFS